MTSQATANAGSPGAQASPRGRHCRGGHGAADDRRPLPPPQRCRQEQQARRRPDGRGLGGGRRIPPCQALCLAFLRGPVHLLHPKVGGPTRDRRSGIPSRWVGLGIPIPIRSGIRGTVLYSTHTKRSVLYAQYKHVPKRFIRPPVARWEAEPACRATRLASEEERSLRGGKASFYTARTAAAGRGAGRLQRGVASAASASAIPRVAHPHTEASGGAAHELFVGTIAWRSTRPWAFSGPQKDGEEATWKCVYGGPIAVPIKPPTHLGSPCVRLFSLALGRTWDRVQEQLRASHPFGWGMLGAGHLRTSRRLTTTVAAFARGQTRVQQLLPRQRVPGLRTVRTLSYIDTGEGEGKV